MFCFYEESQSVSADGFYIFRCFHPIIRDAESFFVMSNIRSRPIFAEYISVEDLIFDPPLYYWLHFADLDLVFYVKVNDNEDEG